MGSRILGGDRVTTGRLTLSVSQPYVIRAGGITYNFDGQPNTDPRPFFTPQFQMLLADPIPSEFGAWAEGAWDEVAPASGPYGATITMGPNQPAPVNPGAAGVYRVYLRMNPLSDIGESPTFRVGIIELTTP
jgi:hypothetical protein